MNNTLRYRDANTSYRAVAGSPLWTITSYPPAKSFGKKNYIKDYGYRFDALPEWMREGVQLMDIAGNGVLISHINARLVKDQYWFFAVDMFDPPKLPLTVESLRSSDGI